MRTISTIILFLLFTYSKAQENISGKYQNELGETLILKSDKTFEYTWKFDLASSWNIGTWSLEKGKLIYLNINEVKDTLKTENKVELVLSDDKISNKITNQEYAINLISGGGQSRSLPPKKLLLKNGKIYSYSRNGKIQDKKLKSVMNSNMLLKPWFEKVINVNYENDKTTEVYYEIKGKIINEILLTPHCGYIAFATVIEFEIINSDLKNYEKKTIPIIIKCPEFYKENFFDKRSTYIIKTTNNSQTEFAWNIPNIKISEKYMIGKEFWAISIEKI